jgi:hypothetical protein
VRAQHAQMHGGLGLPHNALHSSSIYSVVILVYKAIDKGELGVL